jgi:aspartate 1-decarboxylase
VPQNTPLTLKAEGGKSPPSDLHYEGSITIDRDLLKAADIWPHERVEIYNITNGERFSTYALEGKPGSGVICINGAAAHLAQPGHLVIIACYGYFEEREIQGFEPKVVLVDSANRPVSKGHPAANVPRSPHQL